MHGERHVRLRRSVLMWAAAAVGGVLFAGASAPAAICPNEDFREAQGATYLPSCMALAVPLARGRWLSGTAVWWAIG